MPPIISQSQNSNYNESGVIVSDKQLGVRGINIAALPYSVTLVQQGAYWAVRTINLSHHHSLTLFTLFFENEHNGETGLGTVVESNEITQLSTQLQGQVLCLCDQVLHFVSFVNNGVLVTFAYDQGIVVAKIQ